MTEDTKTEITDTGKSATRVITPMRVFLGLAAMAAVSGAVAFTFGLPDLRTQLVLDKAFVHGAVSQIGTDDDSRITKLHVQLGDAVAKGDPLVELSNDRLTAQRDAAAARVARYRADLKEARAANRIATENDRIGIALARTRGEETSANIAQAEAEVALLEEQLSRSAALSEKGFASDEQIDQRRTELLQARANLERRRAQRDADRLSVAQAKVDGRADTVRAAEIDGLNARLDEATAELAGVEARLAGRTLTALDDGIVVDVPSRPGASVGTDDPILSIWDPKRTWMLAWVDQSDIGRIRVGDTARITIDTLDGNIDGIVRRILVASDGEERVLPGQPISPLLPGESRFAIQVDFDASPRVGDLLPGMSGSVSIELQEGESQAFAISNLRDALPRFF